MSLTTLRRATLAIALCLVAGCSSLPASEASEVSSGSDDSSDSSY